jgi:HSP20 family protein
VDLPVLRKHNHHHLEPAEPPAWQDHAPEPRRREVSPLRAWDLLDDLGDLHRQLNGLVGGLLGAPTGVPASAVGATWRPAADVEETPDAYLVEIDLPAVKRDDVEIEVGPGELVVTGEIKEKQRVGFLRTRTRRTGRFDYRVSLPIDIDPDRVTASLCDGVLSVRVPKTEQARRRKVAIGG